MSYSSAQKWSQHSNIHNLEEERFACYSLDALLMAFCTLLITYFLLITRKTIFYRSLFYFFKTVINWYLNRLELLFGLIIHFISVLNESYFYVCIMYVSKIYNFLCMILIFSKSYNFVIKWTFFQYFWILFQTSSVGHPKKVSVVLYCGLRANNQKIPRTTTSPVFFQETEKLLQLGVLFN